MLHSFSSQAWQRSEEEVCPPKGQKTSEETELSSTDLSICWNQPSAQHRRANSSGQDSAVDLHLQVKGPPVEESIVTGLARADRWGKRKAAIIDRTKPVFFCEAPLHWGIWSYTILLIFGVVGLIKNPLNRKSINPLFLSELFVN